MEGQNKKRTIFVGGLADNVTEKLLHGAFIPFGEIAKVTLAKAAGNGEKKGYGFVEYEEVNDAKAAMENMNDAEFFGKVLHVKIAKTQSHGDRAIWHAQPGAVYEAEEQQTEKKAKGPAL